MDTLLVWIGGTTTRYWIWAILAGVTLLAAALDPRRFRPWMFVTALGVCLFACRWPIAVDNSELGIDESQCIASAMKLEQYPIAWKHADLNTSGPLNAYPLSALGWLGLPINFLVTRLFGLATVWVALASGYLLLRSEIDERLARCAVLPAAAFFALTTFHEFVHYTSEHVSLALLGVGSACLWYAIGRGSIALAFFGTAGLGAVPWAKLQGAPIALWFSLAGGALLAGRWWHEPSKRWRLLGAWLAGGCAVSLGFALMLVIWGLVNEWYVACLKQVGMYMAIGEKSFWATLRNFDEALWHTGLFKTFFHAIVAAGIVLASALVFGARRNLWLILYLAGGLPAAIYAITAPGRMFFHYLLYFVMPATLLVGALLGAVLQGPGPDGKPRARWFVWTVLAVFLGVGVWTQVAARRAHSHPAIPYRAGSIQMQPGPASQLLLQAARPGDTLSVWGWMPRLYIETGMVHATRDAQTERQIVNTVLRDFYRNRYLRDLRRYRPRFFVEAVGPGLFAFADRPTQGVESWPELQAYVDASYELIGEAEGCRIFQARAGEAPAVPAPAPTQPP